MRFLSRRQEPVLDGESFFVKSAKCSRRPLSTTSSDFAKFREDGLSHEPSMESQPLQGVGLRSLSDIAVSRDGLSQMEDKSFRCSSSLLTLANTGNNLFDGRKGKVIGERAPEAKELLSGMVEVHAPIQAHSIHASSDEEEDSKILTRDSRSEPVTCHANDRPTSSCSSQILNIIQQMPGSPISALLEECDVLFSPQPKRTLDVRSFYAAEEEPDIAVAQLISEEMFGSPNRYLNHMWTNDSDGCRINHDTDCQFLEAEEPHESEEQNLNYGSNFHSLQGDRALYQGSLGEFGGEPEDRCLETGGILSRNDNLSFWRPHWR